MIAGIEVERHDVEGDADFLEQPERAERARPRREVERDLGHRRSPFRSSVSLASSAFQIAAPIAAPISGATQNSQSWPTAPVSAKKATAVERAGFTEVLVTGIEIRWISVSARPMASRRSPAGALWWVAPRMTMRKTAVSMTSISSGEEAVAAGRSAP